jgi:hypothetical protein
MYWTSRTIQPTLAKPQTISDFYHTLYKFTDLPNSGKECEIEFEGMKTWSYVWKSGDLNPIYLNSRLSKYFGQPSRVAHGMVILGMALTEFQKQNKHFPRRLGVAWMTGIPFEGKIEMRKIRRAVRPSDNKVCEAPQDRTGQNETNNQPAPTGTDEDKEERTVILIFSCLVVLIRQCLSASQRKNLIGRIDYSNLL